MPKNSLPSITPLPAAPNEVLHSAKLDWQGDTPHSLTFEDVYYSNLGGLAEAEHVFINGNDLQARFAALKDTPDTPCFSIGELGFGTGLNIIAIIKAWRARGHDKGRLHITSFEGHPLRHADFHKAQQIVTRDCPELADISQTLVRSYPPLTRGCFHCPLDDTVHLSLIFDDIASGITRLSGLIDAWLLDGFAPAKNPAMWTPHVLTHIRRLSTAQTSFATFSVAGSVRRALIQLGFDVQKVSGFGRKRHMLKGQLPCNMMAPTTVSAQPWFAPPRVVRGKQVAIIGAGIAGSCLAYYLQQAGLQPVLIDGTGLAQGASGNPGGLIMPRLDLGATPPASLYKNAYLHALDFYQALNDRSTKATCLPFSPCGGVMIAPYKAQSDKHDALLENTIVPLSYCQRAPSEMIENSLSDAPENDALTHLYFPQAGVLQPQLAISMLTKNIPLIEADLVAARPTGSDWILQLTDGQKLHVDQIVYAAGAHCAAFVQDPSTPLHVSLGQIDVCGMAATTPSPKTILTRGAYVAPLASQQMLAGATHVNVDIQDLPRACPQPTSEHSIHIQSDIQRHFTFSPTHTVIRRAAWRCTTPDQHPLMGGMPDWEAYQSAYKGLATGRQLAYPAASYLPGVYCLTGLGARGLVTAPLLAYQLCQLMTGGVISLGQEEINLLHPARFFIRAVKRGSL